jgi:NADPH-dependent curcumin reductase CurA
MSSILYKKGAHCLTNFYIPIRHNINNLFTKSKTPVQNAAVIFTKIPSSYPEVGTHIKYVKDRTIDIDTVNTQGGVVTKNLVISIDPYMRGRMTPPETKSYIDSFQLNQPLTNYFVGKIVKSDNNKYKVGQLVYGFGQYEEYTVHPKDQVESLRILSNEELKLGLPLTTWVGAAGMSGQTAFYGLYHIGKPKKGETIFITGASGAVGQIVGQLGK